MRAPRGWQRRHSIARVGLQKGGRIAVSAGERTLKLKRVGQVDVVAAVKIEAVAVSQGKATPQTGLRRTHLNGRMSVES